MMMRVHLKTSDVSLAPDLFGTATLGFSAESEIPGPAMLKLEKPLGRRAFGSTEVLEFLVVFGSGTSAGLVANWLYERLRGRTVSLRIDSIEVELEKDSLQKIIAKKIELNK